MKKLQFTYFTYLLLFMAFIGAMNISCNEESILFPDNKTDLPQASQLRSATVSIGGRVELVWTENRDANFVSYEIYRSEKMPVTRSDMKVFSTRDRQLLSFADTTSKLMKTYYYKIFTLNSEGEVAPGNDIVARIPTVTDPGIWGELPGNEIWDLTTSPVIVKGDVIVPAGKTLTISPGVVVKFNSSDVLEGGRDSSRPELIVRGTLRIIGENGKAVRLTSSSVMPEKGLWGGVWFDNSLGGSNNRIENCLIDYATTGIRVDNTNLGIYGCRVERVSQIGIDSASSHLSMGDSIIHDVAVAGGIGLRVTGNGQITLTNSIINGVFGTGIVIASGSASVQHCIVANCSQDGIEATDPTISNVNNCIFYECKNAIAKQTADGSSTADYNNIWYVVKEGYTRYRNTVAGAHDQSIYPKFIKADWGFPNTGDFSLPAGELLLRLGMSGSAMGLNNPLKIGVNLE